MVAPIDVQSTADFDAVLQSTSNVVAYFWAEWCHPCKQMDVVFAQLAAENPEDKFLKVEAEEQTEISERYGVAAVPFFVFFRKGELIDKLEGADPPELAHKVSRHVTASNSSATSAPRAGPASTGLSAGPAVIQQLVELARSSSSQTPASSKLSLHDRLHKLINSNKTMLFMKGSPEEPRCGFSRKVVNVLKSGGYPFGSFDILTDEEVRQGLKEYSNWPSYPQLYHKGELIGGCDIVLELQESGELGDTLSYE